MWSNPAESKELMRIIIEINPTLTLTLIEISGCTFYLKCKEGNLYSTCHIALALNTCLLDSSTSQSYHWLQLVIFQQCQTLWDVFAVSSSSCVTLPEGRSLSLEEVWSSVHPNFRLRLQNSPLNTISMQVQAGEMQPSVLLLPSSSYKLYSELCVGVCAHACTCVCDRSIPCWVSLSSCSTPVGQKSLCGLWCWQLRSNTGRITVGFTHHNTMEGCYTWSCFMKTADLKKKKSPFSLLKSCIKS